MKRWKLTVEYDGTGFSGWQRQASDITVQQVIEESIAKFSNERVTLHVAGRTDAGVHARGQVAHFDLEKEMSADAVQGAINYYVKPHRIVIVAAEEVPETFHARFSALSRSYRYELVNRSAPLALRATQAWHVSRPLDIRPMQEAAQLLIGHHDFSTFRAQNCQARSPMRTLDQLDIARDGETITFTTRSRSYLYHQVRNMVGTLVWVGSDRWSVKDFAEAFAAADRAKGGPTAPAHGLLFLKVEYPPV